MGSPKRFSKKSMRRSYRCKVCGKDYAMEWAKENHEKLCRER